ncbi:MAG TPA: hypothetical protein VFP61_03535 [Acidimicrobiales bacterium]|nr:hypothetical protein [Acidimicrobiales bacterium]
MALIELRRFHLRGGVDEARWRDVDEEAQAVAHTQPGLLRRTTARRADGSGGWLVIELWRSSADADGRPDPDPALEVVDPATLAVERYATLD